MREKQEHYAIKRARRFIGEKYNRLTLIELTDERAKNRQLIAIFLCDCGKPHKANLGNVRNGHTKSCGCWKADIARANIAIAQEIQFKRNPREASAKRVYNLHYADGDITFEQFLIITQNNCYYCGAEPANKANAYKSRTKEFRCLIEREINGDFIYNGLDRVDHSKDHTMDNVVSCCWDCNKAKLKRTKDDFIEWAHRICAIHPKP